MTATNREEPMEVSTAATLEAVKAVVVSTFAIEDRAGSLDAGSPLLGSMPELDSMGVLELVNELEQRFAIEFDGEDVSAESFETLGSLTALVDEKLR
jgi:acyl carrier protein